MKRSWGRADVQRVRLIERFREAGITRSANPYLVGIHHNVSNRKLVTLFSECLFSIFPSSWENWGMLAWSALLNA